MCNTPYRKRNIVWWVYFRETNNNDNNNNTSNNKAILITHFTSLSAITKLEKNWFKQIGNKHSKQTSKLVFRNPSWQDADQLAINRATENKSSK